MHASNAMMSDSESDNDSFDSSINGDDANEILGPINQQLINGLSVHARISFDEVRNAGPPRRPLRHPDPVIHRAMVDTVTYYDIDSEEFCREKAVFRVPENGDQRLIDRAYVLNPDNISNRTQMGYIQRCLVLVTEICLSSPGSEHDSSVDEEYASMESDDNSSNEDELIFQSTNTYVAVKVSNKRSIYARWVGGEGRAENPWKEIALAQFIGSDHPNLLGIIEALEDEENLYTVMEFCAGGDLYDYMERQEERTEQVARECFRQILNALNQLQICGIFHRDLSIENILVFGNTFVVIDYGMSLRIPTGEDGIRRLILPQGAAGKVRYMAPETFANRIGNRYAVDGPSCDLWAAGVILFVLLTRRFPYLQPDLNDVGFAWTTNNINGLLEAWAINLSPHAIDLLTNIFQLHPGRRYTLAQVMEHPWVTAE